MGIRLVLLSNLLCFVFSQLNGQSVADFAATITSGCPPFALKLNDNSTNQSDITSWQWTINGDDLSTQQDPATLLNDPGSYTICLNIVTNSGSDQNCKTNYITVFDPPEAQFNSDVQSGCVPLDVSFSNISSIGSGGISSIIWDFGGSCGVLTSTANEPVSCFYENPGNFQVSMIVTDVNGCQDNIVVPDFIQTNPLPVLDLVLPTYDDCEPPFNIDFDNVGPNNPAIFYTWDFGNGNTFQGNNPPSISYQSSGPFTIAVNAINNLTGCEDSMILVDAVEEANPINFTFERGSNCGLAEVILTDISGSTADIIEWNFGDGNNSSLSNPTHEYTAFGCYTITLTRTIGNCTKSFSQEVCISELTPLVVNASIGNPAGCMLPHQTSFNVNQINGFTYLWNFGNGETSTSVNPSQSYNSYGDYDVTLTVTDDLGCQIVIPVGVVEAQPISVTLGSAGQQGCAPLNVDFNPNINSNVPIVSYNWSVVNDIGAVVFQSTIDNPSFSFTDLGCYDVMVDLINADGCQVNQTIVDAYCVGDAPQASFSVNPTTGCASQVFSFLDESTGDVNAWQWDFDSDGITDASIQNPTFIYSEIGCYDVDLTISNFGCAANATVGPICVEPPLAAFDFVVDCDNPTNVVFTNNSIQADSVIWDFGIIGSSNDTSTLLNPVFDFQALGTFEVEMIAFNFSSGCSDTSRLELVLEVPQAIFQISNDRFCRGESITLTNISIGATSYLWTVPSGVMIDNVTLENPTITFAESGDYSIFLEVLNSNNCESVFQIDNIEVTGPEPGFEFNLSGNCVPFNVNLIDTSSNLLANNISWEWNIDELNFNSFEQSPQLSLDTAGAFDVALIIEDDRGCRDSILRSVGLNEGAPVAYFTGEFFGCEEVTNGFQNESIGTGLILSWDFGDGQSSSLENPVHDFAIGDYNVCLTINDDNCTDSHCELVQIQEINADFEVDENYSSCAPSPVEFTNLSQNGNSFFWNYGDGSGEIEIEAGSHIYNLEGVYDVKLVAVGMNEACRDSITIPEAVSMTRPIATFEYSIDDFCVPAEMEIHVEGERAYDYLIFFGDGNSYEISGSTNTDTTYMKTLWFFLN